MRKIVLHCKCTHSCARVYIYTDAGFVLDIEWPNITNLLLESLSGFVNLGIFEMLPVGCLFQVEIICGDVYRAPHPVHSPFLTIYLKLLWQKMNYFHE